MVQCGHTMCMWDVRVDLSSVVMSLASWLAISLLEIMVSRALILYYDYLGGPFYVVKHG